MAIRMLRKFLLLALGAMSLAGTVASAQTITLKLHHFLPPGSTAHQNFMVPWCDKIAKDSGGKLKCQIYPAMQLGGTPQQLFDQVKDGVADIIWTVPGYQAGRFPVSEAFELPFMVYDSERASRGLWHYVTKNAAAEYKGIKPILFHVHDGSLLHTTKKQVKLMEDFRGLKVRAPTRQGTKMVTALGAAPVPMPLPQAAEAMSKGVIDGALIPWEVVPSMKFEEITKFHTESPAGSPQMLNTVFLFGMNQAKYDSLPPELKKVIDANSGAEKSAWVGKVFADDAAPGRKSAELRKNTFYTLPDAEAKRWIAATAKLADEWVADMNAKGFDGKRLLDEAKAACK
jgi:TRAP-type C4-dicarboxylate transport system substrate-binding protein